MDLPALRKSPALRPTELSDVTAQAVTDLMREGESQNTQASYRSALRYWAGWFALRYGERITLPVPLPVVLQFVVDHAQRSTAKGLKHELPASIDRALVAGGYKGKAGAMALATLEHRLYVLSKSHQQRELANPCQLPQLRELMAMTRRAYAKRGVVPQKKDALTRDPLQALLATCDDSVRGVRDRALLLFAWSTGGRRRSEVSAADMRALKPVAPGEYTYWLTYSKSNQSGADRAENYKPVVGEAAVALEAWLRVAGITDGAIFRRVRKGGNVGPEALSPAAVRDIVQARCRLAGLAGDFSAHSLRSGFVSEASARQVPLADTMALTGHKSVQTLIGYHRAGTGRAAALRLMGDPSESK